MLNGLELSEVLIQCRSHVGTAPTQFLIYQLATYYIPEIP